jgi:hypothetical protein
MLFNVQRRITYELNRAKCEVCVRPELKRPELLLAVRVDC